MDKTFIAFGVYEFHRLCELRRKLHDRQNVMTFDEQRDFAEQFRLLLATGEPVELKGE
jgi:hypothetical protein